MNQLKKTIRQFDKNVGSQIAKWPKSLYKPLSILCLIIHPVAILFLVLAGLVFSIYNDMVFHGILSLAVLVALFQADVLKMIFRRPRPKSIYVDNMVVRSYSFPSGHAYAATMLAGYVSVWLSGGPFVISYVVIPVVMGVLALVVALSRVYLKAHFPSDVFAGMGFAVIALIICFGIASQVWV